jgi:hypothetical protein
MEISPQFNDIKNEMRSMVLNRTFSVYDGLFFRALKEMPWNEWFRADEKPLNCKDRYLEKIYQWIVGTKLNTIKGLDRFERRDLINGTTQSFDDAYFRHKNRRLRFFRGEYAYHRRVFTNYCFLEDGPLLENDFVIISVPFCSTGELHPEYLSTLEAAKKVNAPVIVECAYFGTCQDIEFDFTNPIIESVSFSLTKGLGLGDIRSGIRFSNLFEASPINQQNDFHHTVLAAARIGIYMMEKFSADHIPTKYRESQVSVCRDLDIRPTNCMHLALGGDDWGSFRIDDRYNTLGIRQLVKMRQLKKI